MGGFWEINLQNLDLKVAIFVQNLFLERFTYQNMIENMGKGAYLIFEKLIFG
jgi:hypothetical protein